MAQDIVFDGEMVAARGGGHVIAMSEQLVTSLGARHMSRVAGTLNGRPFRSNLMKMGGAFFLGVHKEHVDALGLAFGDHVAVEMSLDSEPRGDDIPPAILVDALRRDAAAAAAWENLAPSRRREYVGSIKEAKKDETRERRVRRTIDELAGRDRTA